MLAVDGKPRHGLREPADRAVHETVGGARFKQARRIAEESARYNIGPVIRTINDPVVVLELLDARNSHRMSFQSDSEAAIDGTQAWVLGIKETGRPTLIQHARPDGSARPRDARGSIR